MKILYLGPPSELLHLFEGDDVAQTENAVSTFGDADFVISYNYRHILKNTGELAKFTGRAINLHIAYLPWNRGAHPNVWSWVEGTPHGVSIHCIDTGIDTGDILAQREVPLMAYNTLASNYAALHSAMRDMFSESWPSIRRGVMPACKQSGKGSFHLSNDLERVKHRMPLGWETPCERLVQDEYDFVANWQD